jgi:acyl transferase domain-containing protein/acyl carrier protein
MSNHPATPARIRAPAAGPAMVEERRRFKGVSMHQPGTETVADAAPAASERRTILQNALAAIERLQARLDALEDARREPIAIVGMGCRFPGDADNPDAFWRLLAEERDVVTEIPADRWDVDAYYDPDPGVMGKARTKAGGFLSGIDAFEPGFFGMSPREAAGVDPQQRLLLEVAWEALEHAGVPVEQLDGSLTGVFVGITSMDYSQRIDVNDPARSDIYLATGTALNAAAGRVSFTFGFRGPCMAIDTACSSSLVAIHTACQSLRNGESDLVLAGGVNAILSPDPFVLISKWGMLSPDGRCKTFDASANGFVRGEGCGLLVLERLSDAIAKGRRILAVIPGSAINQDGKSSGLTVPNGLAQQEVVRQALAAARLEPTDVSYVEAHGTGTSLGDPIEVEALAAVYGAGRPMDQPIELGSVKSNIGHLEAAAGVASVIKLVMALRHRQIPASLHVTSLTPAIAWDRLPVRVSTRLHDWQPVNGRRIAGVSGFGFSGMNAHILIEEAPGSGTAHVPASDGRAGAKPLFALPLSARSNSALGRVADLYADHLDGVPEQALADVCATAACGRSHLNVRAVAVAPSRAAMIAQLRAVASGDDAAVKGQVATNGRYRVAFLFTGQGAQYVGMGCVLDQHEPVFRAALDRCAAVLDPLLGRSLREVMFEETGGALDQTRFTQPALYALEVSLAALWRSWGIEPSVVLGHSVGEFAAAVVAGVISLEDGARLIAARGRLMQALPAGGAMLSAQGDAEVVRREVESHAARVSIAAVNGPTTVVIAGGGDEIAAIAVRLDAQGLRTQLLQVSHAFHSPLMDPMVEEFRAVAAQVTHAKPSILWISNLNGEPFDWASWGTRMADYWASHVRRPVQFVRSMSALDAAGCDAHVELGPGATLIGLGMQCVDGARPIDWVSSLRRSKPGLEQVYDALARMYVRGARLDWEAVHGQSVSRSVQLPTYPFQRQSYLIPFAPRTRRRSGTAVHELLGERVPAAGVAALFERTVDSTNPAWLADHRIASEVVMPLTAYLEAALAAARHSGGGAVVALESVNVGEALPLRDGEKRVLQVVVDQASGQAPRIRIFSRDAAREDAPWSLHATASAGLAAEGAARLEDASLTELAGALEHEIDVDPFYQRLRTLGADFGPGFRSMTKAQFRRGEALGEIALANGVLADGDKYLLHPALLDACFHVSAVAIDSLPGSDDGRMYLPVGVDRYEWSDRPDGPVRVHVKIRPPAERGEQLVLDLRIETLSGQPVARLDGMHCRRASRDMFRRRAEEQVADWLYELAWERQALAPSPDGAAARGVWMILDDGTGRGVRLAEEILRRGGVVVRAVPADMGADGDLAIDPARREDYANALAVAAGSGDIAGVVCLWPLRIPMLAAVDVPSAIQQFGTDAALHLLQAVAGRSSAPPRVWMVTAGSQAVDCTETVRIEQAPVAGLARVAAVEHPDLRVTLVDLDPQGTAADARLLADEVLGDAEDTQVAVRKGVRWTARLVRRARQTPAHVDQAPVRLNISERGTLENLSIGPMERRAPGPGEVELRVRASGLNFRDVLSALGMYPGEIRHLGSDCAGEVTAIGDGVTQFAVGDRVVAMAEGAFASHATTRWEFVAPLPGSLDFEQGAAIPTAYLTAEITLNLLGRMKAGDRVLIHSGAGGVGMAGIALALMAGAEIFATAGSDEKREVLRKMGVHHVLDSRSSSFGDEVLRITEGRGVHVVLNSLAGALLDRSFDCLADGGIFLEIGKRGVWSHERVAALNRGLRYHVVDCNDYAQDTPAIVGEIFTRVLQDIGSGRLPWLRCTTFPFEQAADAFRFMAQARHIGRVVFRHRIEAARIDEPVRADVTYVVTGGLRGLGLRTAQWLAKEGARHLLLAGRSEPDAAARSAIAEMASDGIVVTTVQADVATDAGVAAIMDASGGGLPAIGGVLHCAGVLDDGVLVKQSSERFARVMGPKADAAWRLHTALEQRGQRPEFFVLFSSLSAVFGSAGQSSYVAANAFLDALAHRRRTAGLPATSINWGAWSGDGMATRGNTTSRVAAQGVAPLSIADGTQALGVVLRENLTQVSVAPIDWTVLAAQFAAAAQVPPLLRSLVAEARSRSSAGRSDGQRREARLDFGALDPTERHLRLIELVRRELALVLALSASTDTIAIDEQFTNLGLDSLTAVELRNRLQTVLGRTVPTMAAFDWPTVGEMALNLNALFGDVPLLRAEKTSTEETAREEFTL